MLSNLFIFLVTLCEFKRTCICKPFESDARKQRWLQAYLQGVERRDFQVVREREVLCVCVWGGEGGAPLQFKPHYGTLYKTRRDNVQHCANVDSLTYVSRALVASVFRIVERVGSL